MQELALYWKLPSLLEIEGHTMKRLIFTVTNDLTFDQRMIRICHSLSTCGYSVMLIGRGLPASPPLFNQPFQQKRLRCFFNKGKSFYIEFNIRLFFFLLFKKIDCICAIDLDTILPCYAISVLKKMPRVYDAHELFCEMKEIVTRPRIYKFWKKVEAFAVPKFQNGYTVNTPIAQEFKKMYGLEYDVIRNFPRLDILPEVAKSDKFILYQGAVNEGRSFETLIPAMKSVDCPLVICGDGNFMEQAKRLVLDNGVQEKVIFKGQIPPADLKDITRKAWFGLTLFDDTGLSNYLSLANRFSDYIHAGIPQLCVDYPVYRQINDEFNVALLVSNLASENLANAIRRLLNDEHLYATLQKNCLVAREKLNWQAEEKKLLAFYQSIPGLNG